MKHTVRKFLIYFLLTTFYSLLFTHFAFAQSYSPNQNTVPNTASDVPRNLHTWTQTVFLEVLSAATCQLSGADPLSQNGKCLGFNPKIGKIDYVEEGGAIGALGGMISMLYTPQIHASQYFNDLSQNFGITKKAYASAPASTCNPKNQGEGYCGIVFLLPLWKTFRDVVYLLFVVVFIIIGIAIMLRVKIDPRTVMALENQIPKIVMGIILVTFSFAISGILIDFMWIFIYLIFNAVASSAQGGYQNDVAKFTLNLMQNPIGFLHSTIGIFHIVWSSAWSVGGIITDLFTTQLNPSGSNAGHIMFQMLTGNIAGIKNALGFVFGFLAGSAAYLVILVAVLISLFKLWFQLLKCYMLIILDIILAPFWIVAGLIPGSKLTFGAWLRDMASNLIPFPIVVLLFLLGNILVSLYNSAKTVNPFVPPLIGNPSEAGSIAAIVGLSVILLAPQAIKMGQELVGAGAPKYSTTIGAAVGAGAGYLGGIGKNVTGAKLSADEIIMGGKTTPGVPTGYGKRGATKAFWNKLGGRG